MGWQQMHEAISKQYMRPEPDTEFKLDLVVSSPMLRCHAFAEVISKQFAIPLVTNELLKEISFGDWEGKTVDEVKAADPVKNRPHGAESLEAFSQRITGGLSALLKEY
jgi:broad specificity phosphatase PhoE